LAEDKGFEDDKEYIFADVGVGLDVKVCKSWS